MQGNSGFRLSILPNESCCVYVAPPLAGERVFLNSSEWPPIASSQALNPPVDLTVIAMWLGHETTQTTHQYLDADLETKKQALACLESPRVGRSPRSGANRIEQFLKGL